MGTQIQVPEKVVQEPKIKLIKSTNSFNLVVTKNLEEQIRFLCQKSPNKEWSGTLFYTIEGSFNDDNLKVIAKDLFLMDIGNATYTEFDVSSEIIGYITDHSELLNYQMGLIHSHNTMPTFFSGTDTNTLQEEGQNRHNFVSLIVNNEGTYTAAITRQVIRSVVYKDSYTNFGEVIDNSDTKEDTIKFIEYFNLNIEKETIDNPFQELENRFNNLARSKEVATITNHTPSFNYGIQKVPTQLGISFDKDSFTKDIINDDDEEVMDKYDDKIIDKLFAQIITGSIFAGETNVDVQMLSSKLDSMYKNRFQHLSDLDEWVAIYIEFLLNQSIDISYGYIDNLHSELAQKLFEKVDKLPKNDFTNAVLDCLLLYIS